MATTEVNFDGLVGPTHNYAGLAEGNLAAAAHRAARSSPRAAALQGLGKMERLMGLGLVQAVLPPQERPHVPTLRALGFGGTDAEVVQRAARAAPAVLAAASSASSMWAANAATVTPSADAADGRVHLTPANLVHHLHRALEAPGTHRALQAIFRDPARFAVHPPLPSVPHLGDEGAANHTRLCRRHGEAGLELFTYGRTAFGASAPHPTRFPARQTREASEAVARLHALRDDDTFFLQQSPRAIDHGVFHNDVISVGNERVLLVHEAAYVDQRATLERLSTRFEARTGEPLCVVTVAERAVGLEDVVRSYLFNTQLLTLPHGEMVILAPLECREIEAAHEALDAIVADDRNPIGRVLYEDVRESMRNGGGPACLRLRVVLTDEERAATHPTVFLDRDRLAALRGWIARHYRDRLDPADLADPALLDESRRALDELTTLLDLGALYDFQR